MKTILLLLLTFSVTLFAEGIDTKENQEIKKLKAEIAAMKKEKKVLDEIKALRSEIMELKKEKEEEKRDNRFGVGVNLLGPTSAEGLLNLSFDYFINKHLDFEVNFALFPVQTGNKPLFGKSEPTKYETSLGLSLGFNYHFEINKKLSYYLGLHGTIGYTPKSGDWLELFTTDGKHLLGYVPIGIQYMNQNGFTMAIEFGVLGGVLIDHIEYDKEISKDVKVNKSILLGIPSLKLGYHF